MSLMEVLWGFVKCRLNIKEEVFCSCDGQLGEILCDFKARNVYIQVYRYTQKGR